MPVLTEIVKSAVIDRAPSLNLKQAKFDVFSYFNKTKERISYFVWFHKDSLFNKHR